MKPFLVVFHMNGCPHCRHVAGRTSKLNNLMNAEVLEIESSHPICQKMKVNSFPTIWLSQPDLLLEYNGMRDRNSITRWIKHRSKGPRSIFDWLLS